ncbi:hypothetical protein [Novosphingobium kaempferiae]|uniref:hypothetical protein n=1 Tax=Novosphingobium kaempferiae TaxID=2896849 RepID=UPI001E61EA05|nr:hypothetical protein [Novosphingobium kaempferiae]
MFRRLTLVSVIAAATALATPALADVSAPSAPSEKNAAAPADPNKRVCRSIKNVGSYIPQRECHTVAEWQKIREATTNVSEKVIDKLRNTRTLKGDL